MLLIHFKNTRRILCSPFSNVTSIRIVSCEILLIKAFTDYLFKIILFHAILFYFILFYFIPIKHLPLKGIAFS